MKLGERIKQLRNDAELTQPELAVKAGIEQSYLSKLENEKSTPSFEVLTKIASAFDMDAMTLISSLDEQHLQSQLGHLPEIAIKIDVKREAKKAKLRRGYVIASLAIVFGVALVILGNSSSIFSNVVYQYQSMGLINKGEVNRQFTTHPLSELGETRAQSQARIAANIPRIDESFILTTSYQGESFTKTFGDQRRYYRLDNQKEQDSPYNDIASIFGMMLCIGGGFGLSYVFKLM